MMKMSHLQLACHGFAQQWQISLLTLSPDLAPVTVLMARLSVVMASRAVELLPVTVLMAWLAMDLARLSVVTAHPAVDLAHLSAAVGSLTPVFASL